jgi:hypothetical protein
MGRSGVVCSLWYGASKCNGSPTMDTFFGAPWVAAATQARIVTFSGGQGYNLGALIENACKWCRVPKGQVGWGICYSWVKQPLGLWCTCRGIWCYAGEMPTQWVSGWLWVKCTTSAECKPIRIAESSVMDGWNDRYLTQCRFCFHKGVFRKFRERCRTEYSEGTAMAWVRFGVLAGYCRWNGYGHVWLTCFFFKERWSCLIDHRLSLENQMSSPFPRDFTKKFF